MKIFGLILIVFAVAFPTIFFLSSKGKRFPKTALVMIAAVAMFGGISLVIADRITKVVSPFGTITAATQHATEDARAISQLRERVENQSATVDLVATQAEKAKQMSQDATNQVNKVQQKIDSLNNIIGEAEKTLKSLKEEEDFRGIVMAAQNDDRASYDKLSIIADDKGSRFSREAQDAYRTIIDSHNSSVYKSGFTGFWPSGFDPSKLSFLDLQQAYQAAPAVIKPGVIEYIWKRNDIPEQDRMDFMINIMKTDSSLLATEYASRYFLQGAKLEMNIMNFNGIYKWWAQHRTDFSANNASNSK